MSQELVKCPCCDKMVPADNIELTFIRPDDIAAMEEEEREQTCKYDEDIYICEEEYFYLRCILPLPVHDTGRNYCLGVWVQVSEKSFNRICEVWDDEDQSQESPFEGLLANSVPLTKRSRNAKVLVRLVGPTTRPNVIVKDEDCSLYQEQSCGITIHRASEYSDLCR